MSGPASEAIGEVGALRESLRVAFEYPDHRLRRRSVAGHTHVLLMDSHYEVEAGQAVMMTSAYLEPHVSFAPAVMAIVGDADACAAWRVDRVGVDFDRFDTALDGTMFSLDFVVDPAARPPGFSWSRDTQVAELPRIRQGGQLSVEVTNVGSARRRLFVAVFGRRSAW